jgi:hypothetical protein
VVDDVHVVDFSDALVPISAGEAGGVVLLVVIVIFMDVLFDMPTDHGRLW